MRGRIFSNDQVRAIQDGRMTQFMQEVKPQPSLLAKMFSYDPDQWPRRPWTAKFEFKKVGSTPYYEITDSYNCPYGKVGDVIYVRETWCWYYNSMGQFYKADLLYPNDEGEKILGRPIDYDYNKEKWLSPAIMPREAARLFLRIENIRVMRVQELTEKDAKAQGYGEICDCKNPVVPGACENCYNTGYSYPPLLDYKEAMQPIKGPNIWEANKFHWVINFTKTDKP